MYNYLKKLLFCFYPETAHKLSLFFLKNIPPCCFPKVSEKPVEAFGLTFKNPIGLAAGFDNNGDYIDALGKLGFGFIEVGGITPKPQPGNPKPRIFRLVAKKAIINRMGFPNKGVDYLVERLKERKYKGIIGANIAKNMTTSIEDATKDYLICLKKLYPYVDYIAVNVSSPNTPNLRELQQADYLNKLLAIISETRKILEKEHGFYRPILLKISPDETEDTLKAIVNAVHQYKIDGIIATNTTLERSAVEGIPEAHEKGGLSGAPLLERSNKILNTLNNLSHNILDSNMTFIGLGGITKLADVQAKFEAGAKLVQIYTGLIYEGPFLIKRLVSCLNRNKTV